MIDLTKKITKHLKIEIVSLFEILLLIILIQKLVNH